VFTLLYLFSEVVLFRNGSHSVGLDDLLIELLGAVEQAQVQRVACIHNLLVHVVVEEDVRAIGVLWVDVELFACALALLFPVLLVFHHKQGGVVVFTKAILQHLYLLRVFVKRHCSVLLFGQHLFLRIEFLSVVVHDQYYLVIVESLNVAHILVDVNSLIFGFDSVELNQRSSVIAVLERVGSLTKSVEFECDSCEITAESPKDESKVAFGLAEID